ALNADPTRRGRVSDLRDALAAAAGPRPIAPRKPARHPRTAVLRPRRPPRPARELGERTRVLAGAGAAAAFFPALMAGVLGIDAGMALVCAAGTALVLVALLPRAGWLALAFATAVWLLISGRSGVATLALAALLPTPLLLGSRPWLWCAPLLAPLLGLVSLAGAFPALAARASLGAWQRAAVAALGYWWLALTEALLARRLLFGEVGSALPRSAWEHSPAAAVSHVLGPLCSPGRLAPALLWAAGAVVLPWLLGRSAGAERAARAVAWALALLLGGVVLAGGIGAPDPPLPLAALAVAIVLALGIRVAPRRLPARAGVA
ncbi:MAG TPA: hypothetical protein VL977_00650, partial [Solirubrobacteraceae bacterium]|nr:hypothetical protein [Solirubrobacteraceae bacterium]